MPQFAYKKRDASVALYLASGWYLTFKQVGKHVAIYGTDDAATAAQVDRMIAAGKGGVTRITPEEFDSLDGQKKSSIPSQSVWREELVNKDIHRKPELVKQFHPQTDQSGAAVVAEAVSKPRESKAAKLPEGGFRPAVAKTKDD